MDLVEKVNESDISADTAAAYAKSLKNGEFRYRTKTGREYRTEDFSSMTELLTTMANARTVETQNNWDLTTYLTEDDRELLIMNTDYEEGETLDNHYRMLNAHTEMSEQEMSLLLEEPGEARIIGVRDRLENLEEN